MSQSSQPLEQWPADVEFNAENLNEIQKTHAVYLVESNYALPIIDDPDAAAWKEAGKAYPNDPSLVREKLRELANHSPTGKRVIDLYQYYILNDLVTPTVRKIDAEATKPENQITKRANKRLKQLLKKNEPHLSLTEFGRRTYRDGESFIWRKEEEYRFVDPEDVVDEDGSEQGGIATDELDTVNVLKYTLSRQKYDEQGNPIGYEMYAEVLPEDMLHIAINKDSNEKRGRSALTSIVDALIKFRNLLINEVSLRQNQSAIVMVRKVAGGTGAVNRILDAAKSAGSSPNDNYATQETNRSGTTLTVTKGVEVSFAHPDNNFSDAGPLLSVLLRECAKGTGFTFEMLSCDTSEGSLASALVAESPTMMMVNQHRQFWQNRLAPYFKWLLPDLDFDEYEVVLNYPPVEIKDKLKDAQTLNLGVMANAVSRKEMSRSMGKDPEQMRLEIEEESKLEYVNPNYANQNPDPAAKAASSAGNAGASGTNQGGKPTSGSSDPGKQGTENS